MARYIDMDELIALIENSSTPDTWAKGLGRGWWAHSVMIKDNFVNLIKEAPTADVVPKSEVEKLNKELDELAEEHSDLIVEKDELFDIAQKQKVEIEALKIANEKMYNAIEETKAEVIEEYRKKVYSKMEKYMVFGREYIQRILREIAKEMKNE